MGGSQPPKTRRETGRCRRSAATPSEAILTEQGNVALPSDERVDVALAQSGDQQAFERLYRVNVARIYGLACRMARPASADELTQDVFVRAWEKLGSFRGESRFGTWLYRLAVNLIIEQRRTDMRRSGFEKDDEPAVEGASVAPVDATLGIDLAAALEVLPPGARQVFVLHDVEGYKHQEIAGIMGITAGTSKGQLHRARMILRRHLSAGPTGLALDGSQA